MAGAQPQKPHQPDPQLKTRSLLESYNALPARTRRTLAAGIFAFAGVGLLVSDYLETKIPPENLKK
ncbi:hypothetical protein CPB85DRAFT_1427296 [Mucidula mucida]|nr:hypothetical protein CPB85DRAFT_1427296 [Mucidula mucida]